MEDWISMVETTSIKLSRICAFFIHYYLNKQQDKGGDDWLRNRLDSKDCGG